MSRGGLRSSAHWEPILREPDVRDQYPRPDALRRFLARLVGHLDRKVHLIVGLHPAHRSKTVRAWRADHKDEIELHFLPSYSPEPNPDELVNSDLILRLCGRSGGGWASQS